MSEPADLKTDVQTAAEGLAGASGDGFSARAVPVKDIIDADRYLAAKDAVTGTGKKSLGIKFAKLVAPGSI